MRPIDLTMTVSHGMAAFPGSPAPQFITWNKLVPDGYNMELVFFSTHTGTHMDAPRHFAGSGRTIDRIPLARLVTDAVLIRQSGPSGRPVTREDLLRFESENGRIPAGCAAVFHTGWSADPKKRSYYTKNPGILAGAARHLVSRGVGMVGIDSPSIDPGTDPRFSAHHILLGNDTPIVENLTNLGRIPGTRFTLAVLPLKLKGATGSPVRALAL